MQIVILILILVLGGVEGGEHLLQPRWRRRHEDVRGARRRWRPEATREHLSLSVFLILLGILLVVI